MVSLHNGMIDCDVQDHVMTIVTNSFLAKSKFVAHWSVL